MDAHGVADTLKSVAAQAVELARRFGADQAEAGVSYDEGLSVTVRMGELESVERQRDRGLAVTIYKDTRKGSASTTDFSSASVEDTVKKALSIGSFTAQDEYAGLADAKLMAADVPDLDLYFPWDLDVEGATALALRAEDAARSLDARIANSEGATASTGGGHRVYANSHGFVGGYPTSTHSTSCSVVAKSNGSLERDYWYTVSRSPDELDSPESVGAEAARRALQRLGARQLSTRVVPVLFPAEVAKGLVRSLGRGDPRHESVSARVVSARRRGQAGVPGIHRHRRGSADSRARSAARRSTAKGVATRPRQLVQGRRAAGLRAVELLGAPARPANHGECRWRAQPDRAADGRVARGADRRVPTRPSSSASCSAKASTS